MQKSLVKEAMDIPNKTKNNEAIKTEKWGSVSKRSNRRTVTVVKRNSISNRGNKQLGWGRHIVRLRKDRITKRLNILEEEEEEDQDVDERRKLGII